MIPLSEALIQMPTVRGFLDHVTDDLMQGRSVLGVLPNGVDSDELKSVLWSVLERRHWYIDEVRIDCGDKREPVEVLSHSFGIDSTTNGHRCTIEQILNWGRLPEILFVEGFNDLSDDKHVKWLSVLEQWANACQTGSFGRTDGSGIPPALCILANAPNVPFPPPQTNVLLNIRFWWGIPTTLEMQLMCQVIAEGETTPLSRWKQFTIPAISGSDVELASYLWSKKYRSSSELADVLTEYGQSRNWDRTFIERWHLRDDLRYDIDNSDISQLTPSLYRAWSIGMVQWTPEYGLERHSAVFGFAQSKGST